MPSLTPSLEPLSSSSTRSMEFILLVKHVSNRKQLEMLKFTNCQKRSMLDHQQTGRTEFSITQRRVKGTYILSNYKHMRSYMYKIAWLKVIFLE